MTYANHTKVYIWKRRDGTGRGDNYLSSKDHSQYLAFHPHDFELGLFKGLSTQRRSASPPQ